MTSIFRAPPCAVCGGKAGGFLVPVTEDNPNGELPPDFPPLVCRQCRDNAPPGAVTISGTLDNKPNIGQLRGKKIGELRHRRPPLP